MITEGMWQIVSQLLDGEKLPESMNEALYGLCNGTWEAKPVARCETCAYWGTMMPPGLKVKTDYSVANCSCPKICELHDEEEYKVDSLTYCYSEDGGFTSGPKFGCVHHKLEK